VGDIFWKENATMTDNRMDQISVFANKLKGRFRFSQLNFMNGYLLDKTIFLNEKRPKWETREKKIKANAKNRKKASTH